MIPLSATGGREAWATAVMAEAHSRPLSAKQQRHMARHGGRVSRLVAEYYADFPEVFNEVDQGVGACESHVRREYGVSGLIVMWLIGWLVSLVIQIIINRLTSQGHYVVGNQWKT